MTPTEHKINQFIENYALENGYCPSISEIMRNLNYKSRGMVHRYLERLIEQGKLNKTMNYGRNSYEINSPSSAAVMPSSVATPIPMAGRIAAGSPIEAIADSEQLDFFDRFTDDGLYQLEIRGDSMKDIGIIEGDIVLIKPTRKAHDKQIVVALIDGSDATLKRYYKRGKHVELFSENKQYKPQIYEAERVEIQGVLHSVHKFSF